MILLGLPEGVLRPLLAQLGVGRRERVADEEPHPAPIPEEVPHAEHEVEDADADPLGRMHRLRHDRADDELRPEKPEQIAGLSEGQREVREDRDREERLRGCKEQLLALDRADRESVPGCARDREHDRERSHQEGPLVHLRRDEGSEAGVRVQPPREQAGDQKLGRLRREWREPLHQEEFVDVQLLSGPDEGLREPVREEPDHGSRRQEECDHPRPPSGGTERAEIPRRPDEMRLLRGRS